MAEPRTRRGAGGEGVFTPSWLRTSVAKWPLSKALNLGGSSRTAREPKSSLGGQPAGYYFLSGVNAVNKEVCLSWVFFPLNV